jgi:hypothetical protein
MGSDANLAQSEPKTGASDVNDKQRELVHWLSYEYHVVRNQAFPIAVGQTIAIWHPFATRVPPTLPIVDRDGISPFLALLSGIDSCSSRKCGSRVSTPPFIKV